MIIRILREERELLLTWAEEQRMRAEEQAPGLIVVAPQSTRDVQAIVNLARENRVPVLTCNDRYLPPEDLDRQAILLDFSLMNRIERIDDRNLVAHIELLSGVFVMF